MARRDTKLAVSTEPQARASGVSQLRGPVTRQIGSKVACTTMPAASVRVAKKSAVPKGPGRSISKVGKDQPDLESLQQQLAEAEAAVEDLEARLKGVTDRLAWIADRLHGLLDDEPA